MDEITHNDWTIGPLTLNWIIKNFPPPATILELGSGDGTVLLAEAGYQVWTVEDHPDWQNKHKRKDIRYINVPPVRLGKWYDEQLLSIRLKPITYDILLVDGPRGSDSRVKFEENTHLFDENALWIIDDMHRDKEASMAIRLSKEFGKQLIPIQDGKKAAGALL